MFERKVSNIDNIDTANDKKFEDDKIEDKERTLIKMMVLGLRTLSEVRNLCIHSKVNFRVAQQLQRKADMLYVKADRYKQRYQIRRGRISHFQSIMHRRKAFRYEQVAMIRLQLAFKELKTAYVIINKNDNRNLLGVGPETIALESYDTAFEFLQERYNRSMKHIGAGRLPSFREYRNGKESNLLLAKIICDRQLKLITTVMTEIEEDLKNSRMAVTNRMFFRYAMPWMISFRTFHRGDVLIIQ